MNDVSNGEKKKKRGVGTVKEEVTWSDEAWDKQVQVYKIQIKSVYQRTECKSGSTSPKVWM